MVLGPYCPYTVLTVLRNRTHKNNKKKQTWQYDNIWQYHIIWSFLIILFLFNLFTYSMFFYVLYDLSHRINFADLTPRRHWGWFARLCRSDLHLGPQPFQGTGPQHTKIQRLRIPSTSQYSISPDLLKESLVSEEWKWWIENKEKFRADLVGGSAEGQKSNCVCRGQAFTNLSCWFEVFDHFSCERCWHLTPDD